MDPTVAQLNMSFSLLHFQYSLMFLQHVFSSVSEVELVLRHLQVLGLRELVTQSLYEFRVDLEGKLLDLCDSTRQVLLRVVRIFLHLFVPAIAVL